MVDPTSSPLYTTDNDTRGSIPQVVKSGSSCSPNVLSPVSEKDMILDAPHSASDLVGSSPRPVPPSQAPGQLPLFSPSEDGMFVGNFDRPLTSSFTAFEEAIYGNQGLPTPPSTKPSSRNLRLPSFDILGIAAPHPDKLKQDRSHIFQDRPRLGAAFSFDDTPANEYRDLGLLESDLTPRQVECRNPFQDGIMITPPDEQTLSGLRISDPWESAPMSARDEVDLPLTETVGEAARPAIESSSRVTGTEASPAASPIEGGGWLDDVAAAIDSSVNSSSFASNSMKVLSHALPFPAVPGHQFQNAIDKVKVRLPPSPLVWINLLHAVPGRFSLGDLPTSPPSTPGQPVGESEDYFTTKVFESAVTAVDYDRVVASTSRVPPLAAPSSINLSIVERYIPPSSGSEFADMFNPVGTSILVDRLIELAPGNGCLLFIYPTKTGGRTFLRDYLGPVLDPILRSMVVVNNFTSDFSTSLGRMPAVSNMHEFESLKNRAETLCQELSGKSPRITEQHHGLQGSFSVAYSGKHSVTLERKVWSDWWCRQQKPAMRAAITDYFQRVQKAPTTVSAGQYLIQEILEGVSTRSYQTPPTSEVEVGVFVIRRDG